MRFLIIAILVNNAFKTVQQRAKDKEDICRRADARQRYLTQDFTLWWAGLRCIILEDCYSHISQAPDSQNNIWAFQHSSCHIRLPQPGNNKCKPYSAYNAFPIQAFYFLVLCCLTDRIFYICHSRYMSDPPGMHLPLQMPHRRYHSPDHSQKKHPGHFLIEASLHVWSPTQL